MIPSLLSGSLRSLLPSGLVVVLVIFTSIAQVYVTTVVPEPAAPPAGAELGGGGDSIGITGAAGGALDSKLVGVSVTVALVLADSAAGASELTGGWVNF